MVHPGLVGSTHYLAIDVIVMWKKGRIPVTEEIDATEQALHHWLDAIAAGNLPTVRLDPPTSVSLLQCQEQVVLVCWLRASWQGDA